jgi:hypothetical protein
MKIRRNIILNILLLLTVFFSSGIDAHPDSENKSYILEQDSGSNNSENKLSAHFDISEEDRINQSHNILVPEKSLCQKSGINSLSLPNKIIVSVWQPPKIF